MMKAKRSRALRLLRQRRTTPLPTIQPPPPNHQTTPLTDVEQEAAQLLATLRPPAAPPPPEIAWQWAERSSPRSAPVVPVVSDGVRERLRGRGEW